MAGPAGQQDSLSARAARLSGLRAGVRGGARQRVSRRPLGAHRADRRRVPRRAGGCRAGRAARLSAQRLPEAGLLLAARNEQRDFVVRGGCAGSAVGAENLPRAGRRHGAGAAMGDGAARLPGRPARSAGRLAAARRQPQEGLSLHGAPSRYAPCVSWTGSLGRTASPRPI